MLFTLQLPEFSGFAGKKTEALFENSELRVAACRWGYTMDCQLAADPKANTVL